MLSMPIFHGWRHGEIPKFVAGSKATRTSWRGSSTFGGRSSSETDRSRDSRTCWEWARRGYLARPIPIDLPTVREHVGDKGHSIYQGKP